MKNTLIILSFMLLGFKAQAQQLIIPIEEANEYIEKHGILPKDKHFKDVNGILDKYTGTWEGSLGDKNYSFLITKKMKVPSKSFPLTLTDGLVIQFKITDKNTGKVLYDKFKLPEKFHLNISSIKNITKNKYSILYKGDRKEDIECGDAGKMFLEIIEPKKLTVNVTPSELILLIAEGEESPCPGGRIFPPFPFENQPPLVLIKK